MFGLGAFEIAIIAFLALIFIGPKKLPELAKGMGKFIREFQDAIHGMGENSHDDEEDDKKDETPNAQLPDSENQANQGSLHDSQTVEKSQGSDIVTQDADKK